MQDIFHTFFDPLSKPKTEIKYRAFFLSVEVIKFLDLIPKRNSVSIIVNQLIRSVTSIGANVVEAKASSSKREFFKFPPDSLKKYK